MRNLLCLTPVAIKLLTASCVACIAIRTYSTCSFNPLENEAVVAALLLRTGAVLEGAPALEGLPTRPGLTTWAVLDDGEELYPQSYSILTQSDHLWPSLVEDLMNFLFSPAMFHEI